MSDLVSAPAGLLAGIDVIQSYLPHLSDRPGVYRMIGDDARVLYVGKARALRKRVTSYAQPDRLPLRLKRMVAATTSMEFVETHTEVEALLLEANMIKALRPPFNVLLKDDKMFPYILMTGDHDFPRVMKYRGSRKEKGDYFGPFATARAVAPTLKALQQAFLLRNCTDSYFAARKRPCLQHDIRRCSAPCVGKISKPDYAIQVKAAKDFLSGRSQDVQKAFADQMQAASAARDYEAAARFRDRIRALTAVQTRQDINLLEVGDADVVGVVQDKGITNVQVYFIRGGQNYGNLSFFPSQAEDCVVPEILAAFLPQFYDERPVPPALIVQEDPEGVEVLAEALAEKAGRKVELTVPQRGARRRMLDFALSNGCEALERHMAERASSRAMGQAVAELFGLQEPPQRIEIYDNSHLGGTQMVGAMVVAGPDGFIKNSYRKFNIREAGASDDFAMMHEVIRRRFKVESKEETIDWPDLLLIDGGLGQLHAVLEVLGELRISDDLTVVGISKGPDRNAGREVFHMEGRASFQLPVNDPVLHYLQRLRDEAHRFAIGAQRARRTGNITRSVLDDIPGIGPKRKKALLLHFGSAQAVRDAALVDLEKVEGISKAFAEKIYSWFHDGR